MDLSYVRSYTIAILFHNNDYTFIIDFGRFAFMGYMFFESYEEFFNFILHSEPSAVAKYLADQYKGAQNDAVVSGRVSPMEVKKKRDKLYNDLLESPDKHEMFKQATHITPMADDAMYWHHYLDDEKKKRSET